MRECNADHAGPSREWRPEGVLLVLLQANGLSIVLLSSVFYRLQKKKKKNNVQIGDDIAAFLEE